MYIFKTYLRGYYSGYNMRVKQVYNLSIWKPRGRFQQFSPDILGFLRYGGTRHSPPRDPSEPAGRLYHAWRLSLL